MKTPHNQFCPIPCRDPNHTDHVHTKLDQYGYCTCGTRVITQFRGFPLPDRPHVSPSQH